MSFDGDEKQWKCVKGGQVNFQRVSSIVRDIGEPCLHQSPIKVVLAVRISARFFLSYVFKLCLYVASNILPSEWT